MEAQVSRVGFMVVKVTLWQIFPEYIGFLANHHSTYCPILAYHLGLVQ
jgi:hypothetical protein